ncbi:thiol reductant ABC exporter subunit CydD [Halomonas sp. V046]|uniref:thiol reductant ABC exporter subunit CydD n=1 Tax=Halomonas sp. V046 TaxID=3459611 RepID=UPI0040447BA9
MAGQAASEGRWLWLAVAFGACAGLATVAQLVLLAVIIDRAIAAPSGLTGLVSPGLVSPGLGLLALVALRPMLTAAQDLAAQAASQRLRRRVRATLLDHLARLGPVRVAAHHSAGLAHQWVEQVEALDGYVARFWVQLRLVVLVPVVILVLVAFQDWLAAILLAVTAPFIPLFMALVGMGAESLNREQFVAVARLSGHFVDRVRGITTLRLFGAAERATVEVTAAADDYRRRSMRTLRLAFLSSAVLEFFSSVAIAVVAIYIGFGLLGDIPFGPASSLTLFSGLVILLLAPEFFQPLRTLSQSYHDRAAALAAADGLLALFEEAADAHREAGSGSAPAASGALVELIGASLAYPGRGRVLGPLDLAIAPGEVVVLTGPSGAGKSSVLQMLAGFVAPCEGARLTSPGFAFAWMDQRPLLIQGSLGDNLRLTAPQASDTELVTALEQAGLGEVLAGLPAGLDTGLGERGRGLSGGQAQRLALARIFLSDAPLVLLDEPTASLDAATEAVLIDGFQALAGQGRSLVIATHHPTLMGLGDRRLALDGGQEVVRV